MYNNIFNIKHDFIYLIILNNKQSIFRGKFILTTLYQK